MRLRNHEYESDLGGVDWQMGMVDRGAQLDWLSQYPDEKEILLPPLTGLFIVAAISIPWHYTGFSCGLRFCCEHKRSLADAPLKKRHAKKLVTKWGGEPVLDGT